VHTGMVRADFLQLIADKRASAKLCCSFSASNSLSLKIWPLTPLDPGFWQIKLIPGQRNPNKSKILQIQEKKSCEIQFAPSSSASLRFLGVVRDLSLASQ
jgi:hypothetical protein